jgi:hypothetical protein
VREWAHTLPSGLPFWELKSLGTFEFSKNDLKGQILLNWNFPYTIRKLSKCRCLKWAYIHLSTYNTSYGQKKNQESEWQFNSWPLKVGNFHELCVCKGRATYIIGNLLMKVIIFFKTSPQSKVYTKSYKCPKWQKFQFQEFWNSQLGSTEKNDVWVQPLWLVTKNTTRGKAVASLQVRVMVSLMNPCMFMVHPCTISVPTMH